MEHSIKPITRTQLIHAGKTNTVYATDSPDYLELESSDWFWAHKKATKDIDLNKGIANNLISSMLLKYLEKNGIPTHYVCEGSNSASKIVKKAQMIPLSVICHFEETQKSDSSSSVFPSVEFTFKDSPNEPPIYPKVIPCMSDITLINNDGEIDLIKSYTQRAGELMQNLYEKLNINLVDFKLKFGRLPSGEIILCDEFSPDTCHLIDIKSGKSLDKNEVIQILDHLSKRHN